MRRGMGKLWCCVSTAVDLPKVFAEAKMSVYLGQLVLAAPPDCSAFLKLWEFTRLENPGCWRVCILMDKLLAQGIHKINDFAKREILSGWSPALGKNYTKNEMLKMHGSRKHFFVFSIRALLSQICDHASQRHINLAGHQQLAIFLSASSQGVAHP